MIRRILVLFALFTLTFVSAVSAHEHGMGRMLPAEATTQAVDHGAAWGAASDTPLCADARNDCHNHEKFTDCACPAACIGLFSVVTGATPRWSEAAGMPTGAQRLLAMSSAPPTPPPRA
jgi:hypothetical protein